MGTAMMAPDYAWWHGFYELKHRFAVIYNDSELLRKSKIPQELYGIPGRAKKSLKSD